MKREDIYAAVLEYIELIETGRGSAEQNFRALECVLDKLAFARHFVDYEFDSKDYPIPPREEHHRLQKLVSERFPGIGFYNLPSTMIEKLTEAECFVGDADDDAVDIAIDLHEVAWRWKNTSAADALFHFEDTYSHWGEHLRNLQRYLHALKMGE